MKVVNKVVEKVWLVENYIHDNYGVNGKKRHAAKVIPIVAQ